MSISNPPHYNLRKNEQKTCLPTHSIAVVTGGANGIGKATVKRLARDGFRVIIADIDVDNGCRVAESENTDRKAVDFIEANMGSEVSIKSLVKEIERRAGRIDAWVNCAASFVIRNIEATKEEWWQALNVSLVGYALCIKHALPLLQLSGKSSIVNVSSISAHIAQPNFVTYSACKGAVSAMSRCLALDLAPWGIRVNAICPGTVWTEANAFYTKKRMGLNKEQANKHSEIGGRHVLQRVADPEEIASAISFLVSQEASFITASDLFVDGGYTAL